MSTRLSHVCRLVVLLLLTAGTAPFVQAQEISLGGQAFLDYYYWLVHPVEEVEGQNGFQYRRLFLTTDIAFDDRFVGRARLEVQGTNPQTRPTPFVKDLYLRWRDVGGSGHDLTFGVQPTPTIAPSRSLWGYRSLDATLLNRIDFVSPRDFGLSARGPLTSGGTLRYAVLLANDSGVRPEGERYKRVSGQLRWQSEQGYVATVGADYAAAPDADDDGLLLNTLLGYRSAQGRIGFEGFWGEPRSFDQTFVGGSLFGAYRVAPQWEPLLRVDMVAYDDDSVDEGTVSYYLLGGVAYVPNERIRIVPNVIWQATDSADDTLLNGRLTVYFTF